MDIPVWDSTADATGEGADRSTRRFLYLVLAFALFLAASGATGAGATSGTEAPEPEVLVPIAGAQGPQATEPRGTATDPELTACVVRFPPHIEAIEEVGSATWSRDLPKAAGADTHDVRLVREGAEAHVLEAGLRYVPADARLETRDDAASARTRQSLVGTTLDLVHRSYRTCPGGVTASADRPLTITFAAAPKPARPPTLSVDVDGAAVEREGATLAFWITLDATASETVSVHARTVDGTARAGADYHGVSRTVVFPTGTTRQPARPTSGSAPGGPGTTGWDGGSRRRNAPRSRSKWRRATARAPTAPRPR